MNAFASYLRVLAFFILSVILLPGCLSRPNLAKQSFAFPVPPAGGALRATNDLVLGLHRVGVAAPFDSQSLVYRTGEFSYEQDPYAEFLVPPAESLREPLRAYFRESGAFGAVTEPDSARKPNTLVEVYVDQLYGDFRNRSAPVAVLGMRFIFYEAAKGPPGRVLLQKGYYRRVRLKARTAAALMAGWDEALKELIKEAATDFARSNAESHTTAGALAEKPVK